MFLILVTKKFSFSGFYFLYEMASSTSEIGGMEVCQRGECLKLFVKNKRVDGGTNDISSKKPGSLITVHLRSLGAPVCAHCIMPHSL